MDVRKFRMDALKFMMDALKFRMDARKFRYLIAGSWLVTLVIIGLLKGLGDTPSPAQHMAKLSAPAAPTIMEPSKDKDLVSGADVHMESMPLQDNDSGSGHLCTDWEIWTVKPHERVWFSDCIRGVQRLHAHLGDGVFQGAFAGRESLLPRRDYELRVRHRDDSGDAATEWSPYATRLFRTDAERKPLPGAPQWRSMQPGYVVEEVAGDLQLPVNIAVAPAHSISPAKPMLYVTELYGQIKVVRGDNKVSTYAKNLLNFDPMGKFPGAGELGVTGISVDQASGDVFASMLFARGDRFYPKVVRFHSTDGGFTASSQTTIIEMREPQEASHQISNLTIGPDGKLYVHMGDGFTPSSARNLNSFRGKILRMNLDGSAPEDNPFFNAADGIKARDYVFASGFRNPFGGAWRAADKQHYEVENGTSSNDRLARVTKGADYGWNVHASSMRKRALYNWTPTHAPVNITFVEAENNHSAGFPSSKYGHAFVSESGPTYATGPQARGKRIVEFSFNANGTVSRPKALVEYNGWGKSSVAGLAAAANGLYFTGLYPDNAALGPAGVGAKLYRVRYAPKKTTGAALKTCGDADLTVTAQPANTSVSRGTQLAISLTIKSTSNGACRRDVGPDMQELKIMQGIQKIWSSDDCGRLRGNRMVAFRPGNQFAYTVIWNGKSTSSCAPGAQRVPDGPVPPAGEYTVTARVGTLLSKPVTLTLR